VLGARARVLHRGPLGFTGGTLLLIATIGAALSVFTGLSWLRVAEAVGAGIEWAYAACARASTRGAIARRARPAAAEREEKVEEARKIFEDHEPIRIEMPPVVVPKSERIVREKQVPLFADLPDSPLPPARPAGPARHAHRAPDRRDARVHLAPDREEAARLQCPGEGGRGLIRAR
jgi:hypothetical protein